MLNRIRSFIENSNNLLQEPSSFGLSYSNVNPTGGQFNPDTASASDIANMSANELDTLLSSFGVDASKYSKYFAKFDDQAITDIVANYQNKKSQLTSKSKSIIDTAKTKGVELSNQERSVMRQSGFEGAGGVERAFQQQKGNLFGQTETAMEQIGLQKEAADIDVEQKKRSAYEDYQEKFYSTLGDVEATQATEDAKWREGFSEDNPGDAGWSLTGSNLKQGESWWWRTCAVSSALYDAGSWNAKEKYDAVMWCQDTHHDGTDRGKTWIKGYHTWGKFLSKWVKKSNIICWVIEGMTTAFVDHVRRNKPNYLGPIVHHLWINPLSYVIGYSKKNKILGKLGTVGMIGMYSLLLPLFGIATIPHKLKRKLWQ